MTAPVIIGDATLYLGDCRDILPTLTGVDAVVTDPPYGVNYRHGGNFSHEKQVAVRHVNVKITGDDEPFDPSPFLAFGKIALFGANNFASKLPDSRGWLVWNKRSGMQPMDQGDCELIWTNQDKSIKQIEFMWSGVCRDGEENGSISLHPTQKPIDVMVWIINQLGNPVTILDPFMGSGTTGVACARLGRRFIGIECEKKYFDISCERIDREYAQGKLFT